MEVTEGTNREGHRGPRRVAYSRRAGNGDARVYARLVWRVYAKTALQENDFTRDRRRKNRAEQRIRTLDGFIRAQRWKNSARHAQT